MGKTSLPASKKLMQNYLSELLTEESVEDNTDIQEQKPALNEKQEKLNKLLQQASVTQQTEIKESITSARSEAQKEQTFYAPPEKKVAVETQQVKQVSEEISTAKSLHAAKAKQTKSYRDSSFQAMFFDVAGLQIAVPLVELGGIHNVETITPLMGKPPWFKGVMLHREEKINTVDTARWVMPEKCNEKLLSSLEYQYVIMLNNSSWGLMAENLIDTVTLSQDDVKWVSQSKSRPWLAGLVKDRMCALMDVDELIAMLNEGADINHSS